MPNVRQQNVIATAAALDAVSAAITEGASAGVAVSVAVVDPGMNLLVFARSDTATPHSAETCRRKANTAASTRRPTGWMPPELATALPLAAGNLLTNVLGGVPVVFDGQTVGGLGIAGGTPQQDADIAAAVLTAIGAEQPG
jgi:uncharacterized protein GlcG (DUF336 family)